MECNKFYRNLEFKSENDNLSHLQVEEGKLQDAKEIWQYHNSNWGEKRKKSIRKKVGGAGREASEVN